MFSNLVKKQLISTGISIKDAIDFQAKGRLFVSEELLIDIATTLMINGIVFSTEKKDNGYLIDIAIDINDIRCI